MTACGLKTEGPLLVVDRRSYEERSWGGEEYLTVDGLFPCRQFLDYSWA